MSAPETGGEETLLLPVPRSAVRQLERVLALGLLAESRATGARPTADAERLLRQLHTAAHTQASSAPGTLAAAPTTVDPGIAGSMLGMREAAAVLGCTPEYVRRLARTNRLRAQRVGGVWVVDPRDLDALRYGRAEGTDGIAGPAPADRTAERG